MPPDLNVFTVRKDADGRRVHGNPGFSPGSCGTTRKRPSRKRQKTFGRGRQGPFRRKQRGILMHGTLWEGAAPGYWRLSASRRALCCSGVPTVRGREAASSANCTAILSSFWRRCHEVRRQKAGISRTTARKRMKEWLRGGMKKGRLLSSIGRSVFRSMKKVEKLKTSEWSACGRRWHFRCRPCPPDWKSTAGKAGSGTRE